MTRQRTTALLIVAMLGAGWWVVFATGGTYNASTHVMYIPIVLAAVNSGPVGGLLAALAAGGLMAFTPVYVQTGQAQSLIAAAVRTAFYLGVGCLVGEAVRRLRHQQRETQRLLLQSVTALTTAMSVNQQHTAGHSLRVADTSVAMGEALGLDERTLFVLRMGGLLHDVGKLAVPLDVLNKTGRLTADEYRQVKEHPVAGARILQSFDDSRLWDVHEIVLHHHERLDGSGYPLGLQGNQITLPVRIVAVADVYDALTTARPYRGALTHAEAMVLLRREGAEGRLDASLVELVARVTETARERVAAYKETVEMAG